MPMTPGTLTSVHLPCLRGGGLNVSSSQVESNCEHENHSCLCLSISLCIPLSVCLPFSHKDRREDFGVWSLRILGIKSEANG